MKQKVSNYCQNLVKKYKGTEIKCSPVYFNSTTKTVINHKFDIDKSGGIVESIESQYINNSTFRLLRGSSYIKLPVELRNSEKD